MLNSALEREEYIEQVYFFRVYRERLEDGIPSQEILTLLHEEVLATTKLPIAIEFLRGEMLLTGRISDAMLHLAHYFTAFQSFVMSQAEEDRSKFDQRTALEVLEREAKYRSETPTQAGLFVYQFECIARNRLGYEAGMLAMADDPAYDTQWSAWIRKARLRLGATDFCDLIYYRSEQWIEDRHKRGREPNQNAEHVLFGHAEGRIAKANRGRDPLLMFAALQRQLGYPRIPKAARAETGPIIHPMLDQRLHRLEMRLKLVESEVKGDTDLSQFYFQAPERSPERASDNE